MHIIKQSIGNVVADETQSSVKAIDAAALSQARFAATLIEAAVDSNLPIAATQKLMSAVASAFQNTIHSRADLAIAAKEIALIQSRSNLETVAFGCPGGTSITGQIKITKKPEPQSLKK
jgi:hypothetical protein